KLGKRPTHPELLDWLAAQFIENGWSVKKLHRLIMNSAAYQRASQYPAAEKKNSEIAAKADPENNLLSRFTPRRIEAEVRRDSLLAVPAEWILEVGGPGGFLEVTHDVVPQPRLIMARMAPA